MEKHVEVIVIGATGDATAMNSDSGLIHKASGRKHIQRATEIMHDQQTDTWYIAPVLYPILGEPMPMRLQSVPTALTGFEGYQIAVAFEISWVKSCMLLGIEFVDDEHVCTALRRIYDEATTTDSFSSTEDHATKICEAGKYDVDDVQVDASQTAMQVEGIELVVNELLAAVRKLRK